MLFEAQTPKFAAVQHADAIALALLPDERIGRRRAEELFHLRRSGRYGNSLAISRGLSDGARPVPCKSQVPVTPELQANWMPFRRSDCLPRYSSCQASSPFPAGT